MVKENNCQFRLPIWENTVRLQSQAGKRSLFEVLSCNLTSSKAIK